MAESQTEPRTIDKIRAAFTDKQWEITVPEWGGLTIYFRPLTAFDLEVSGDEAANEKLSITRRNVKLLIKKARNADGTPMFYPGDENALMTETRFGVLMRVIQFMNNCGTIKLDDAKEALTTGDGSPLDTSAPSSSETSSPSPVMPVGV